MKPCGKAGVLVGSEEMKTAVECLTEAKIEALSGLKETFCVDCRGD